MDDLQDYIEEQMKDPKFREEYESLVTEYDAIRAVIALQLRNDKKENINIEI